ncbi:unnamed protein product [Caenorhabditis angaria]|uniref:Ribosomal silencing factor RsfS n=1 Tax=Caenorhabditis angaria TaxID=860376 RepID=A0A9P1ILL3_9PELO|nr:unnamed protein product [Caenorhabditis angaria]
MSPYDYKIICSTYNSRQAAAISENLRKMLKLDGDLPLSQSKSITKRSNGWYVAEIGQIQIHVMSEECREKYDLETIWAGDEKLREEIENEVENIMLPPKNH